MLFLCFWAFCYCCFAVVRLHPCLLPISHLLGNRFHSNNKHWCSEHNLVFCFCWLIHRFFWPQRTILWSTSIISCFSLLKAQLHSKISKRSLQKDSNQHPSLLLKARPADSILKLGKRIIIDTRGIRLLEEVSRNRFINMFHMFQSMIIPAPENNGVALGGTWQSHVSTFNLSTR